MRERAPVWAARFALLTPLLAFLAWLSLLPATHVHYWPFGYLSNVAETVVVIAVYVVAVIAGIVAIGFACTQVWFVIQTLWCIAWRLPHVRLSRRWSTWDSPYAKVKEKESDRYVRYDDKPQPLIRGRVGSK